VEQLRNPLSRKGRKMLERAQRYSRSGDYAREIEQLRLALDERSARPYALGMLGVALLRTGQVQQAITELERAVQLLPHDPTIHSNLGYAYGLTRQLDRAERSVERSLEIDRHRPRTRYLMGLILLDRGGRDEEALAHLRYARREVSGARLAIAAYLSAKGQSEAADQELAQYFRSEDAASPTQVQQWMKSLTDSTRSR
jgi:Flp pilus assembly protein TadD